MTSKSNDDDIKQVNRSGFPFQLKVEHDIRATKSEHGWSVASREHPWENESRSGFIDLVLKHEQFSTFRIVIECKRLKADDARQLRWLFLVEETRSDLVLRTSSLQVEADLGAAIWDDVLVNPASLESQFCALQGDNPGRNPLLENLAKEALKRY